MNRTKPRITVLLLTALSLAAGLAAAEELTIVESAYVCMVNDARYDKEQVPVDVEGKTYYGCCDMCKARLAKNETLRMGVDPVSGNDVDKAEAIIAADSYRRVFYFESEETLEEFKKRLSERE